MTPARTILTGAAAFGAAVLVFTAAALPPAPRKLAPPAWQRLRPVASGVFHVHTMRSDGTGTVDEVAAAAARAGLQFVIVTDHGDGTRPPDAPAYRSGVLCLDAVEISTTGGHYAALGLGRAPYPLGGEPRDVVEDVARLGGFGVATHPDSPKAALAWRGWDAPFDAIEWLNADSAWRGVPAHRLVTALFTYPVRPAETIAALCERPDLLAHWDRLAARRRVLALAGSDAHARAGWTNRDEPYDDTPFLRAPSYENTFRAFSLRVTLDRPLSGNARDDADRVLAGLRAGHVHTLIDAFARPGAFEFSGQTGSANVLEGDEVRPGPEAVLLRVRTNAPAGSRLVLFRDGAEVTRVTAANLVFATNHPGAYRAEAWLPGIRKSPMPWAASNPIFLRKEATPPIPAAPATTAPSEPAEAARAEFLGTQPEAWRVEHDPSSSGSMAGAISLAYRLGAGPARSQFVALVHEGRLPAAATGLAFRGTADAPMRVSVQLRIPGGTEGERWARSVYLDATPRDIVVPFAEMRPAGPTRSSVPRPAAVTSILFAVDRVHAKAGSAGRFTIERTRASTF